MLTFQRLDVYRVSLQFVALVMRVVPRVPRGNAGLRDQLRRAAMSIPLNIAEGAGRQGRADAARHYAIARGSAMECAAAIDLARALGLDQALYEEACEILERLVAMLTRMAQ